MKFREILAFGFFLIVIGLMSVTTLWVLFFGANTILSIHACYQEGYNLYEIGSIFPKSSPICEYLNETTMEIEYIKLNSGLIPNGK